MILFCFSPLLEAVVRPPGQEGDGQRDAGQGRRRLSDRELQGALLHPREPDLRLQLPSQAAGDVVQGALLGGREDPWQAAG